MGGGVDIHCPGMGEINPPLSSVVCLLGSVVAWWFQENKRKTKKKKQKENKTRSNGNLAQAFCATPYSFYSSTSWEV